jgi:RES domain-containing protein
LPPIATRRRSAIRTSSSYERAGVIAPGTIKRARIEERTSRLVPTRHPPIQAFEDVAAPEDLDAVIALEGWTNDRLVAQRLRRLPRERRVFGRANASVIMAAFLHASPSGARFNGPDLGAWYCSLRTVTAIAEIAHHLRREATNVGWPEMRGQYRCYGADLAGNYVDIRGQRLAEIYDPASWAASQVYGERLRATGEDGIVYDSLRHAGGANVVAYDPRQVLEVTIGPSFDLIVPVEGRIVARQLA